MEDEEIKNISSSISSMSIEANTSLENEDSFKKDGHAIENTSKENVQDTLGSGENPDGFDIIKNILGNCKPNLSVYFPRFEDAKIVNCSISCLSQQSIDSLFPELGYRDIFKKALEDFRSDYQSEEKRTPAKNGVDNYRKFTSWKKKKISAILNQYGGAHIHKHYQEFQTLDDKLREEMVHIIIKYFIDRDIWLSNDDFPKITEIIGAEFKNENLGYFCKKEKGCPPVGKLVSRFANQNFKLRKQNVRALRRNTKQNRKIQINEKNIQVSSTLSDAIEFLKTNKRPWDVIESKWKETHKARMQDIKDPNIPLETTTATYPLITSKDLGPLLVSTDFDLLNGQAASNGLLSDWDNYAGLALEKAYKKTKKQKFDPKMFENNQDLKDLRAFQGYHHLLVPVPISVNPKLDTNNPVFARKSNKAPKKSKKKGKSKARPVKFYVMVNHFYLEVESFKHAVDLLLKSFYVFNASFPKEGATFCQFLQEMFFKIDSGNPVVNNFIKEIKYDKQNVN